MKIYPIILLFLGGCVLTVGDIAMDYWTKHNRASFYIGGMLIYVAGLAFLAQSFKYKDIAVASIILVIFNVIVLSIVGWLYFKESLSFGEIAGIFLGLIAVIILEMFSSSKI